MQSRSTKASPTTPDLVRPFSGRLDLYRDGAPLGVYVEACDRCGAVVVNALTSLHREVCGARP